MRKEESIMKKLFEVFTSILAIVILGEVEQELL